MVSPSPDSHGRRYLLREDLKIGAILRVLWFHKAILLSVPVLFGIAAIVYSSNQEKIYKAVALIKINNSQKRIIQFGDQVQEVGKSQEIIENYLVHMNSTSFLKRIVGKLNLTSDPQFSPITNIEEASRVESPVMLSSERTMVQETEQNLSRSLSLVADNLREQIEVGQVGNSHIVSIAALSSSPTKASKIANTIARTHMTTQVAGLKEEADNGIKWLEERIAKVRGELVGIEGQIINYMSSKGIDHFGDNNSIEVRKTELAVQLAHAKAARTQAVAQYDATKTRIEREGPLSALKNVRTPVMTELRSVEVSTMRRLSQMSQEYGPRHPSIVAQKGLLLRVRQRMEEEATRVFNDQINEVAVIRARERELGTQLEKLKSETTDEQYASIELNDLKLSAETHKKQLEGFLKRHSQLIEESQIFEADAEIISLASTPTKPAYPKPLFASLMAVICGLSLSSFGIFLADRWVSDFGFKSLEELKDFGLKPLGVVPDLRQRKSAGVDIEDYILTHPRSSQAEAFQRIRTRLCQLGVRSDNGGQSVMVTSSAPTEGKTTTAIALARQAAEAGLRTLLVDADLRRPRIHHVLNADCRDGLCDLLTTSDSLVEAIVEDHLTPLHFIPAGLHQGNPADLFRTERMGWLMSELSQNYDWIVVDTPPIGAVSDCLLIGPYIRKTIYVARWRSTYRNVVLSGVQQLKEAGTNVDGVILSRINTDEQAKYGDADFGQYYGHYQKHDLDEAA